MQFSGFLIGASLKQLGSFMSQSREDTFQPLLLCVGRKYDETPSKITVSFKTGGQGSKEENATAKVIQTRCHLSMLLRHGDGPSSKFCFLDCNIPTWLQAVDRTTAETTKAAQKDILNSIAGLQEASSLFRMTVHQVTTDKYAANLKCEQLLGKEMPDSIISHYTCDVRKLAAVETKTLRFVDGHVSAMIAGALALGEAGTLRSLRESLDAVLADRLKVLFGEPPSDSYTVAYRTAVLNAFLPVPKGAQEEIMRSKVKKRCFMRRCLVSFFLNDDLQDDVHVHFWTTQPSASRQQVVKSMSRFLVPALLPSKPPLFFRSKWTGFQGAYQYFGLLALCHNLLKPLILHFFGSSMPAAPAATATAPEASVPPQPLPDEAGTETHGVKAEQGATSHGGEDGQKEMDLVSDNIDWRTFNVKMRQKLKIWVTCDPGPQLLIISLSMKPVLNFVHRLLSKGSKEFERTEKAKQAKGLPRTFVVLEACRMLLVPVFIHDFLQGIVHSKVYFVLFQRSYATAYAYAYGPIAYASCVMLYMLSHMPPNFHKPYSVQFPMSHGCMVATCSIKPPSLTLYYAKPCEHICCIPYASFISVLYHILYLNNMQECTVQHRV